MELSGIYFNFVGWPYEGKYFENVCVNGMCKRALTDSGNNCNVLIYVKKACLRLVVTGVYCMMLRFISNRITNE